MTRYDRFWPGCVVFVLYLSGFASNYNERLQQGRRELGDCFIWLKLMQGRYGLYNIMSSRL